jgi:hypothetical protein
LIFTTAGRGSHAPPALCVKNGPREQGRPANVGEDARAISQLRFLQATPHGLFDGGISSHTLLNGILSFLVCRERGELWKPSNGIHGHLGRRGREAGVSFKFQI